MNPKRSILAVIIAANFTFAALPAAAESAAAPAKAAVCAACHGEGGGKPIMPEYPVIAGQYANYLAHTLHEYKDGKRKNPIMGAQAATLSDAEIAELAKYFASQQSPLYTPKIPEHKAR